MHLRKEFAFDTYLLGRLKASDNQVKVNEILLFNKCKEIFDKRALTYISARIIELLNEYLCIDPKSGKHVA